MFRDGVAFDTNRFGLEVVQGSALVASHTPPMGRRYWFGVINVDLMASVAYTVTLEQARAILSLKRRESWNLPDSVWEGLEDGLPWTGFK